MKNFWIFIFLVFAFGFLESYLAKKESKWPGLILPFCTLLYSLLTILFMAEMPGENMVPVIIGVVITMNIPTLFFLLIYFIARKEGNKEMEEEELRKMKIQDL